MSRPRAADDFTTIRARLDELNREPALPAEAPALDAAASVAECDRRAGSGAWPVPWLPTIFVKQPPV